MRRIFIAVPALVLAGTAAAQGEGRPNPLDPQAKVPPVVFRSAFEAYRPFAEQELRDWRRANEEVGAAGGHAERRPGQGRSAKSSNGSSEKNRAAPGHEDHGAHK